MLRNHSNTYPDDGPHTLRSGVPSPEISILRPSHHSLSFISNCLEISLSPTRTLIQEPHKHQCSVLDMQTSSTTAITYNESSCCKPTVEIPFDPYTTNQEKMQQLSGHLFSASNKNEEIVLEEKNTDGHIFACEFQRAPVPTNANLPEILHEFSPKIAIHKSNLLSEPTSHSSYNVVPEPNVVSSSVMPLSLNSSEQFFSFVIFHAPEDQKIASRVCDVLENLGVERGTTFCEGFETPGVSPLTCLENAVENSAYIILLLTNAFLEARWGGFQSTTAIINSIENADKKGSVIPFYPYSEKPHGKIPIWIKSLIPLDENSPIFQTKVRNTFKSDVIKNQYECWRRVKQSTYFHLQQQQNVSLQWSMGDTTTVLPQQAQPPLPVLYGQTPIIQICHAGNVQIGDQNSMNVQFSPYGPHMDCDTNIYAENETSN